MPVYAPSCLLQKFSSFWPGAAVSARCLLTQPGHLSIQKLLLELEIVQEHGRLFNKDIWRHNGERLKVIVKRQTQPLVLDQPLLRSLSV